MAFFEGGGGNGSVVRVNPSRPQAAARAAYSPPPPRVISQAPTLPPIITSSRAHAAAGRAQVPYQHPQAPNPTNQRATGKGTPAQRLALALAWEQRIPQLGNIWATQPGLRGQPLQEQYMNGWNGVNSAVGEATGSAKAGIENLVNKFNPNAAIPNLPAEIGATGGMYRHGATAVDALPPRLPFGDKLGRTQSLPVPNYSQRFAPGGLSLANPGRIRTLRGRSSLTD